MARLCPYLAEPVSKPRFVWFQTCGPLPYGPLWVFRLDFSVCTRHLTYCYSPCTLTLKRRDDSRNTKKLATLNSRIVRRNDWIWQRGHKTRHMIACLVREGGLQVLSLFQGRGLSLPPALISEALSFFGLWSVSQEKDMVSICWGGWWGQCSSCLVKKKKKKKARALECYFGLYFFNEMQNQQCWTFYF